MAKRKALLRERDREAGSAQQQRDPESDRERAAAQQPRERTAESEAGKRQRERNRETAPEKQRERTINYYPESPERQSERRDRESAGVSSVVVSVSPLRPASAEQSTPTCFQRTAGFQPPPISLGKASEKEVNTSKYWHR